jgi:hypothetical protein
VLAQAAFFLSTACKQRWSIPCIDKISLFAHVGGQARLGPGFIYNDGPARREVQEGGEKTVSTIERQLEEMKKKSGSPDDPKAMSELRAQVDHQNTKIEKVKKSAALVPLPTASATGTSTRKRLGREITPTGTALRPRAVARRGGGGGQEHNCTCSGSDCSGDSSGISGEWLESSAFCGCGAPTQLSVLAPPWSPPRRNAEFTSAFWRLVQRCIAWIMVCLVVWWYYTIRPPGVEAPLSRVAGLEEPIHTNDCAQSAAGVNEIPADYLLSLALPPLNTLAHPLRSIDVHDLFGTGHDRLEALPNVNDTATVSPVPALQHTHGKTTSGFAGSEPPVPFRGRPHPGRNARPL